VGGTQLSTSTEADIDPLTTGRVPTRPRGTHAAPGRARRPPSWARFGLRAAVRSVLTWTLLGLLLGVFVAVTGSHPARVQALGVLTGSMRPTLGVGDLVIDQVIRVDQIRAGDIVTYQDSDEDRSITHRVQSVSPRGDLVDVVTRGDANDVAEYWTASASGKVGRVVLHVPRLGYLAGGLGTTAGQVGGMAVALFLGGWALLAIWRPEADPGDDDA
jgi:signal peptidase